MRAHRVVAEAVVGQVSLQVEGVVDLFAVERLVFQCPELALAGAVQPGAADPVRTCLSSGCCARKAWDRNGPPLSVTNVGIGLISPVAVSVARFSKVTPRMAWASASGSAPWTGDTRTHIWTSSPGSRPLPGPGGNGFEFGETQQSHMIRASRRFRERCFPVAD